MHRGVKMMTEILDESVSAAVRYGAEKHLRLNPYIERH